MSQENVETGRRAWMAAASTPPDWSVISALYHPDHVLESDWGGINDTSYRGASGFRELLADLHETWDKWRQEVEDVVDAGENSVVVAARLVAEGKRSATPVNYPYGVVVTLDRGKIIRTRAFASLDDALEAVGLSE